jgi:hypothetical protein
MSRFLTPEAVNSARSKYGAGTVILVVGLFGAYLDAQFVLTDDTGTCLEYL